VNTPVYGFVNLNDFEEVSSIQLRAKKIFAKCFSQEELEFLQRNAELNQAVENIQTLEDSLSALELGERLTNEAWVNRNYPEMRARSADGRFAGANTPYRAPA
jgi:hypothetical protein